MYIIIGLEKNLDSRSLSLIETYNSLSSSKTIFINSKSNNLIIRLIKVLFTFIKEFFQKYKNITGIIVLFKSHLLYPFIFVLSKFFRKIIIFDLGYPFKDNSSYENKFIKNIYSLIEIIFLNNKKTNLLLESDSQIRRLKKKFRHSNLYSHYMTESKGFEKIPDIFINSNSEEFVYLENLKNINYILFRGRLNYESGILEIIKSFHEYSENKKKNKIKLVIQGRGMLEKKVIEKLKILANKDIIFINKFISNSNMEKIMKSSIAILGQFNNYQNRLNYTIPNKYYEALKLNKFYITPSWEPLKHPYLEKTKLIFPLIDQNYNFKLWLINNLEFLIKDKCLIDKDIKIISSECLNWHRLSNKSTLKNIIFNS